MIKWMVTVVVAPAAVWAAWKFYRRAAASPPPRSAHKEFLGGNITTAVGFVGGIIFAENWRLHRIRLTAYERDTARIERALFERYDRDAIRLP